MSERCKFCGVDHLEQLQQIDIHIAGEYSRLRAENERLRAALHGKLCVFKAMLPHNPMQECFALTREEALGVIDSIEAALAGKEQDNG